MLVAVTAVVAVPQSGAPGAVCLVEEPNTCASGRCIRDTGIEGEAGIGVRPLRISSKSYVTIEPTCVPVRSFVLEGKPYKSQNSVGGVV